jgi:putative transposase
MTRKEHGAEVQRLCGLAQVSRAGYYRHFQASAPAEADTELRDQIQSLSLQHRHYGYRRITAQLARAGTEVNGKRVQRLMREDNLLVQRTKPFIPRTTLSRHSFSIVPNLTRKLIPSGLDQIWVADITYIRLIEEFIYLAVVLDAFSRRAIGWALDDHLEAALAIEALDMALALRKPVAGSLIHHSDRGVQYACNDYAHRLETHGIAASMSRTGNPYDNAKAESFMKTLKHEEVNGKTYKTLADARRDIGLFIDTTYNTGRLHSSLGYKPPIEFEAELSQTKAC